MKGTVTFDSKRGLYYLRYSTADGRRPSLALGKHSTRASAKRAAAAMEAPPENPVPTFAYVAGRYVDERMTTRYSTRRTYVSWLDTYILPKWGAYPVDEVRPMLVQPWLLNLDLSPKSRVHIRDIMVHVLKAGMFWEYIPQNEHPLSGVKIEGASKRESPPRVLAVEEFNSLLQWLGEPYRTMVLVAQCLGLRFSELIALKWPDVDWFGKRILIERASVNQRVGAVKSEYSKRPVPLDDALLEVLKAWHQMAESKDAWIWASASSAFEKPFSYTWMCSVLSDASKSAGIGKIGWHTFRHTYRSWLNTSGAGMSVQQKLMRHADIRTTMNTYGDTLPKELREANGRVVRMVIQQ